MPRFVVHRGGAALWPENSLLAFRNAIALGARLLEFDVHRTADAEAAVIHDPTLDRTTNGSGPVAARTAAELRGVRLKGLDGALTDEWVPTIDEVLALAGPAGEGGVWPAAARANFLGLHYTLCDERVVRLARRAGIAVGVFTVNDEAAMGRLVDLDVDVIITDRADLAVRKGATAP